MVHSTNCPISKPLIFPSRSGDAATASTTLSLYLNETEYAVSDFLLTVTLDTNVQALLVSSPNADLTIKTGKTVEIKPGSGTNLALERVDVIITYKHAVGKRSIE